MIALVDDLHMVQLTQKMQQKKLKSEREKKRQKGHLGQRWGIWDPMGTHNNSFSEKKIHPSKSYDTQSYQSGFWKRSSLTKESNMCLHYYL